MSLVNDSFKSLAILLSGHIAHNVSAKSLQESSEYPSMTDFKAQIMTLKKKSSQKFLVLNLSTSEE